MRKWPTHQETLTNSPCVPSKLFPCHCQECKIDVSLHSIHLKVHSNKAALLDVPERSMSQQMRAPAVVLVMRSVTPDKSICTILCTCQSRGAVGICRFEDFGLSPNLTASLQALYNNDIDSVDWFLGVLIEQPHLDNTFLGEVSRPTPACIGLGFRVWGVKPSLQEVF